MFQESVRSRGQIASRHQESSLWRRSCGKVNSHERMCRDERERAEDGSHHDRTVLVQD